MDISDQAQQLEELFRAEALAAQAAKTPQGTSATECKNCEQPIPLARQQAIQGVQLCISCQQAQEDKRP